MSKGNYVNMKNFTLLFVCSGNTCRSPMAEGIFNARAAKELPGTKAVSCGLSAIEGSPASENAISEAARYGADLSGHAARAVSEELVAGAGLVFAMTEVQAQAMRLRYPDHATRVGTLEAGEGIADPFGGGHSVYSETAAQIYRAVERLIQRLKRGERAP